MFSRGYLSLHGPNKFPFHAEGFQTIQARVAEQKLLQLLVRSTTGSIPTVRGRPESVFHHQWSASQAPGISEVYSSFWLAAWR